MPPWAPLVFMAFVAAAFYLAGKLRRRSKRALVRLKESVVIYYCEDCVHCRPDKNEDLLRDQYDFAKCGRSNTATCEFGPAPEPKPNPVSRMLTTAPTGFAYCSTMRYSFPICPEFSPKR
jgi:hypothetical protein